MPLLLMTQSEPARPPCTQGAPTGQQLRCLKHWLSLTYALTWAAEGHTGRMWGVGVAWRQKDPEEDFPGGPVVKTLHSQCRGLGSIPGQGTRSRMPQLKDPTCHN